MLTRALQDLLYGPRPNPLWKQLLSSSVIWFELQDVQVNLVYFHIVTRLEITSLTG